MVKLLEDEGDPDKDLQFWRFALQVIQRLGMDGMSSDESGGEEQYGADKIYRVKIMVWRRRMEDILTNVDQARRNGCGLFSLRGAPGIKRIRPPVPGSQDHQDWPSTNRDPLPRLPFIFYDDNWFSQVTPEVRQTTLHVSAEEFAWFSMYSRQ
jgi:hypothetical protein